MQNKINTLFLESLIKFDFFFELKSSLKNNKPTFKILKTKDTFLINNVFISPAPLLKEFKQFIRLIQFFKKYDLKICIANFKDVLFLDAFKLMSMHTKMETNFVFGTIKNNLISKLTKMGFISFQKFSPNFYKKMHNLLNYIYIELLFSFNKTNSGNYTVSVNFNTWRKFVFLFLIFNSIYKNKNLC